MKIEGIQAISASYGWIPPIPPTRALGLTGLLRFLCEPDQFPLLQTYFEFYSPMLKTAHPVRQLQYYLRL